MDKLKIALYSTQVIPTNPDLDQYGGLEIVAGNLAKYFDEMGHEVSLFGCKDSYEPKNGILFAGLESGKLSNWDAWVGYWKNPRARKKLMEADIVHSNDWGLFPYSVHDKLKNVCHTHHGPGAGFEPENLLKVTDKPCLIGVSPNHAKWMQRNTGLQWRGVNNGIDLKKYTFQKQKEDYFLFVGRWDWFKGVHRFVKICDEGQFKGVIIGGSFGDTDEYCKDVKALIDKSEYVTTRGSVGNESSDGIVGKGISHDEKVKLMQNAKAVVLPNVEYEKEYKTDIKERQGWGQFIEPFGLVSCESLACGTPVICTPSGGLQGQIVHGKTGFFANSDQDFISCMRRIEEIKPEVCRMRGEDFSYQRMGNEYLRLYQQMLNSEKW